MGKGRRNRIRTQTSPFGTSGRISHNSTPFYTSRLYQGMKGIEGGGDAQNTVPGEYLNRLFCKSSENMDELPDNSVHLMVTSPPYNVRKEYDQDLSLDEYLALLHRVWAETYRVLAPGGRACVNIANLGRRPYIPLHAYVIQQMQEIGFLMRGEVIWNKGSSSSASTAWGSWCSPSNPVLRDVHEYILIFSKGTFRRSGKGKESTITRDEFLEWTKSVWHFPAASAKKIGHPAPFPLELPYRLIQLFTFKGDVVLDPFVGSGTTCLAAAALERHYVGYDTNPEYLLLAQKRLDDLKDGLLWRP